MKLCANVVNLNAICVLLVVKPYSLNSFNDVLKGGIIFVFEGEVGLSSSSSENAKISV